MSDKKKVFEEAFARGKDGGATQIESWLAENKLDADASEDMDNTLRENPELSVDREEELQLIGEYIGRLDGKGKGAHLSIVGTSGMGKTQICLLLQSLVQKESDNIDFHILNAEMFQKVESGNNLEEALSELSDSQRAVVCVDNAWRDKKITYSLNKLNNTLDSVLIISTWTPEGWQEIEDEVRRTMAVDNKIELSPLSPRETEELIRNAVDKISKNNFELEQDFFSLVHEGSQGIPGLILKIVSESLNQAFLNNLRPFGNESVQKSIEKIGISSVKENVKGLGSMKKSIAIKALRQRDERGVRPKKLSKDFQKSKSTISYHLRDLESKKILEKNQVGRSTFYKVRDDVKPLIQLQLQGESEFYA